MILSKKYNDAMDKIVMSRRTKKQNNLTGKKSKEIHPQNILYTPRGRDCRMFGFNGYIYNSF